MFFKPQKALKREFLCHSTIIAHGLRLGLCIPAIILAACTSSDNHHVRSPEITPNKTTTTRQVGILLPLSGRNGVLGNNMLKAAKLAMADPSSPPLDVRDTEISGASVAAQQAIAAGDGIILGPLTASETASIAPITTAANVPVLSYTSDVTKAQPNLWVMGVTPEQQVETMVVAAKAEGKTRFAALLPDNALGHALADSLTQVCSENGLASPQISFHSGTSDDISQKLKQLSNYDSRLQEAKTHTSSDSSVKTADTDSNDSSTSTGLIDDLVPPPSNGTDSKKDNNNKLVLSAPPFDALLLGDTGLKLQSVINALKENQIFSKNVRLMGPGLWSAFASKLGKLHGAWYAAPDPSKRQGFVQQYMSKYGTMPKPLADLTYDSSSLVRSLDKLGGYTQENLTRNQGFDGVDGLFTLSKNGHIRRSLRIFEIQPGGGGKLIFIPATQPKS